MAAREARHFESPALFRRWLAKHHASAGELWVGFFKKGTGRPSLTWPESVDEALCFGWIDGRRQGLDAARYRIRFTPRRKGSIWSAVNVERFAVLEASGRVRRAGRAAFADRRENRSGVYSYEQRRDRLDEPYASLLRRNKKASVFFESRPASYRRAAVWWVVSAKQEETRRRRLERLISLSAAGRLIPQFTRRPRPGSR
ncbi:MAG TPA: YdeI/OmpD-associated family protein [Thermoanaerobaculia bacterium]|nr:YdeI/OmpD-associated family protein [Thermoanaerobaculia bacterium]